VRLVFAPPKTAGQASKTKIFLGKVVRYIA